MIPALFLVACWGLVLVQLAWFWPNPPLAALLAGPLALLGLLLLRSTPRRRALTALLSLPYFALGTMEWAVQRSLFAAATVTLCVLLYLLLVADNVRRRERR